VALPEASTFLAAVGVRGEEKPIWAGGEYEVHSQGRKTTYLIFWTSSRTGTA
jgi:hypothetical protein